VEPFWDGIRPTRQDKAGHGFAVAPSLRLKSNPAMLEEETGITTTENPGPVFRLSNFALKYFSLSRFAWELEPLGLWLRDLVFKIRGRGFQ
jgi:hypothetical protein